MAVTNLSLIRAFKSGLSRHQVAHRYGVLIKRVDEALRLYLYRSGWRRFGEAKHDDRWMKR